MGNTHAFSTRLPALTAAALSSAAVTLTILAGNSCDFLQVTAKSSGQLLLQTDDIQLLINEASIGVLCEGGYFEREGDQMWELSWYFVLTSLGMGSLTTALAWAESLFLPPTTCNWKFLSVLASITAVVQVPIFLLFESEPCSEFDDSQSCQLSTGSYLLLASTVLFICVTMWTQCRDPPIWALEMSMWKSERQNQSHLSGDVEGADDVQHKSLPDGGDGGDADYDDDLGKVRVQTERVSPWQRMFGSSHHPDVEQRGTLSTEEETGKIVPMGQLGAFYESGSDDEQFNFATFDDNVFDDQNMNNVEQGQGQSQQYVPSSPARNQGILKNTHRGNTPQRSVRIVEAPRETPPRTAMSEVEHSINDSNMSMTPKSATGVSTNASQGQNALAPIACFAPSLADQDNSEIAETRRPASDEANHVKHTPLEKTPLYQQPFMACTPSSQDILQDLEAENMILVQAEQNRGDSSAVGTSSTGRPATKQPSPGKKPDPPQKTTKKVEQQQKKYPSSERFGANVRSFTNRVRRDSHNLKFGRRSNPSNVGYTAMDDDSLASAGFPSTPPIEVKIDPRNAQTPTMEDDEGFPKDWVAFNTFPTAAAQFAISAEAQEKSDNTNIRILSKIGDEDESQPAAFYHSDPEPDILSSDDDSDGDEQDDQNDRNRAQRQHISSDNSTLSSKSSYTSPGKPPLPRKRTPTPTRSTRSVTSLMETPIAEETVTDILREDDNEARMAAYALSKLNSPAMTGRGRNYERRAPSREGPRSFSPSDRIVSTPMKPRTLDPSLSPASGSSISRRRQEEEKKEEAIDDFILGKRRDSPIATRSPPYSRQGSPRTERLSSTPPRSPRALLLDGERNAVAGINTPSRYTQNTELRSSTPPRSPRTLSLNEERNALGGINARPTPHPVVESSYMSDDSGSTNSENMSMEARRARMNRLREKISADADKSNSTSRARQARMARVRGHAVEDNRPGTPTRSNVGASRITPQKTPLQERSRLSPYGKPKGTPATAPNESFESYQTMDALSQDESIAGFLAEAGAALDSLGVNDVKSITTDISRGYTPSVATTDDLDDLDVQLIHTRRPLYAEYGDEEASM